MLSTIHQNFYDLGKCQIHEMKQKILLIQLIDFSLSNIVFLHQDLFHIFDVRKVSTFENV